MTQRGRPKKFDEPLIKRRFALPQSLSEKVDEASRPAPGFPKGRDAVDIVREALTMYFSGEGRKEETLSDEFRSALVDAVARERERDALLVKLRDSDRERLQAVAEAIGYTEPADLVEDVMRTLLRRPEEISEMLLGQGLRAIQQALEAEGQHEAAAAGRAEQEKLQQRVSRAGASSTKKAAKKAA